MLGNIQGQVTCKWSGNNHMLGDIWLGNNHIVSKHAWLVDLHRVRKHAGDLHRVRGLSQVGRLAQGYET